MEVKCIYPRYHMALLSVGFDCLGSNGGKIQKLLSCARIYTCAREEVQVVWFWGGVFDVPRIEC